MRLSLLCSLVLLIGLTQPAHAAIQSETVEYTALDAVTCEGYFAWDDSIEGPRPAVLVVHQYQGPGAYERKRADMLAELGYLAFVCDIYGTDLRPNGHEEGLSAVGMFYGDRELFRTRLASGLSRMLKHPLCDASRTAAIGYCFGGTGVLELARSGAALKGVVCFHGNLDTSLPASAGEVQASVLVCHGADDPFVPAEQVAAFESEMRVAGADWQLIKYSGALHAFTIWGTDMPGMAAYQEAADLRSWRAMQDFFNEIFE